MRKRRGTCPSLKESIDATSPSISGEATPQETLIRRYHQVRQFTERLCQPLVTEDYVIQAMPDVSPPKWHLAHTSWFFETFVLASASPELSIAACLLCLPVQFLLCGGW